MAFSDETKAKVESRIAKLASTRTKRATGTLMLAGVVVGLIMWLMLEASAESAVHQIYAVAWGLFVIVGAYVVARGFDNWHDYYANREEEDEGEQG